MAATKIPAVPPGKLLEFPSSGERSDDKISGGKIKGESIWGMYKIVLRSVQWPLTKGFWIPIRGFPNELGYRDQK
jgi:hypothetical protein